jgi:hypothetical protein
MARCEKHKVLINHNARNEECKNVGGVPQKNYVFFTKINIAKWFAARNMDNIKFHNAI